ncbi:MAG TPA: energy transducer TonB [Candidatus Cybelea sp.]|nr:energy transducer TonB [Candidatus Cybelea sp.]
MPNRDPRDHKGESFSRAGFRAGCLEPTNDESFLARLRSNFSDFFAGGLFKSLIARQTTGQVAPVGMWANHGWRRDPQFARVEALSISMHVMILALLVAPLLPGVVTPGASRASYRVVPIGDLSLFLKHLKMPQADSAAKRMGGGGGGGDRDSRPAGTGVLALFNRIQLAPPKVRTAPHAAYPVQPTILGPEEGKLLSPAMDNWGNPVSPVINDSNGPGNRSGIGTNEGHGVGPGAGDGFGPGSTEGAGERWPMSGAHAYSEVACVYCPAAQFSDEAVKAKLQGTVIISLLVTVEGRPMDVRVLRGLGMGLDEKATDAVRKWRFRPSIGPDGKLAEVRVLVEVVFHLY